MVDEPSSAEQGASQASPEAPFDLNAVLGRKEVQEHLLGVVRQAVAEADGRWEPQVAAAKKDGDRRASEWGEEKRRLKATATAADLNDDAIALRDRLLETDDITAKAEARIAEAEARQRQLDAREALLVVKEQFPKLPKAFWDDATERLRTGKTYSSIIAVEAMALAGATGAKPAPEPTAPALGSARQGADAIVTTDSIDKLWMDHEKSRPGGLNPYDGKYRDFLRTGHL